MLCPNCQTMNPPQAKFCLECGNRLLVCANCGTVNLPAAKFCIECGTALQPRGDHTVPLPTAAPPPYSPAQSEAASAILLPSEERRVVTIMFADITGSTPLADRMDPEDMRAILTGYFNLMTEQIRKHGGTVEKYIGDAVMAVFGSPIAHEDDPDRAIRAALDMQEALTQFNQQRQAQDPEATHLQMRIGINTGEVAIPNTVTHQRQDFLITGDAVNVAARLQQVAAPDTILVGERTYLTTREVFEFRPLAPLLLKGKPEPIAASVVLGLRNHTPTITQHPRGIEGQEVRLVGRSLELTLLHANYARVLAERHPHLITILGTPGIGKSRLVNEFIAREQDKLKSSTATHLPVPPKILQGHCPPYGDGITYWPLVEMLRSLLNAQDGESNEVLQQRLTDLLKDVFAATKRSESAEEIAHTITRRLGKALSGKAATPDKGNPRRDLQLSIYSTSIKQGITQATLLRAWRIFLEALAEVQPLIIIIDDLQWADEALLNLLEHLTDRITNVPILFLCPARTDFFEHKRDWGGGRRNFTTIELEALSREESSELVEELLNAAELPDVLRYTILTRSEGNPFFVEEIVRMFIDQGILIREENSAGQITNWRVGAEGLLSELTIPTEHPDDSLINMHYLLPLPRVPDTIQGVLAARVDLLNPAEKLLLQHAAVIGRTFWLSSLGTLASDLSQEILLDALDSLIMRDFIIETEQQGRSPVEHDRFFMFKHVLIRDVVYNNIPRMRRSQEHAHLACWLEKQAGHDKAAYAELLSYHYQQAVANWSSSFSAGAIELPVTQNAHAAHTRPVRLTRSELRRRAITYLMLAGDQALLSYYTVRAVQAYNDALELVNDDQVDTGLLVKMHVKLGDAYSQRSSLDEAWQEYRKALRLAEGQAAKSATKSGDGIDLLEIYDRLAELATRWSGMFNNPPSMQDVQPYIDAGLQLLAGKSLCYEQVAFLNYRAFWYIHQMETTTDSQKTTFVEQALASGHEALRLAEEFNDPATLSLTLDAMSFIYGRTHKYEEAHRMQHRRQLLEKQLTDREELYDLYMSLGYVHEQVADYPTAQMWFGRAWSNAQTMESPALLLNCMVGRMRAWRQWNRWDAAYLVARDILQLIEQYQQDEKRQLWALETLATIAYRRGDQEEGDYYTHQYKRLLDQQAEELAPERQAIHATSMHAIHMAREDWTQATVDYKEKLRQNEPQPSPEVVSTLAELFVITGESSELQASTCERAITLAEESGARKSVAVALRARGRMYLEQENWKLAEADLRHALHRCEVLDLPWERANTLYQLGLLYRRRADSNGDKTTRRTADLGRARYHFEQALGFFESLKATPSIERVRQMLAQSSAIRI